MLKVLFSWHAAVLAANQKYVEHLAAEPDMQVTLLLPPRWDESTSMVEAHIPAPDATYEVRVDDVKKGCKGLKFRYRNICATLTEVQPDVIFLYEEPYSYVAWQILYWKRKICPQAKFIFYTWQNLDCRYSFFHRQAEKYVFAHSDCGVAGSRDVEDILRLHGFKKEIQRVPLALDPTDFPACDSGVLRKELGLTKFTVGYVGQLLKDKGLEYLFQAIKSLHDRSIQLLLIGNGKDSLELKAFAKKLQISDQVIFIDYVKNKDMFNYYQAMDVLVLPSRTTPVFKEQFGRVLIEAMICGTPVIGSSSGEIPLVIGDAGLIFLERDAQSLAAAIAKLIDDPGLRQRLASAGRERVLQRFTWKKIAQQTAEIIRTTTTRRME